MAQSAKAEAAKEHNAPARREQIRMVLQQALTLERQRRAKVESEVKPIQDKLTKLFRGLKTDLNIPIGDARAMFKLYLREQDVAEWEDDDEAAAVQDAMRELFEAMQEGDMLDFITVLERTAGNEDVQIDVQIDTTTGPSAEPTAKGKVSSKPSTRLAAAKDPVTYEHYSKWLEMVTDADHDAALGFYRVSKGWVTFSGHCQAVKQELGARAPATLAVDDGSKAGLAAMLFDPEDFDTVIDKLTPSYDVLMLQDGQEPVLHRATEEA